MIYIAAAFVLLAVFDPAIGSSTPLWDYEGNILGPDMWARDFPECGGSRQSPINIQNDIATSRYLIPFNLSQYSTSGSLTTVLTNDEGHTVKLSYSGPNITIQGGYLPGQYILDQLHFHWGSDNFIGSEHQVNGDVQPMEMHIVHHSKNFSEEAAATSPAGLAVLGFFFKLSRYDNAALEPLVSHFNDVTFKDEETVIPTFNLTTLLPVNVRDSSFWRYSGSLTTPPCYQSVVWTIFKDKIRISKRQLAVFRSLKRTAREDELDEPLVDNFRPIQPRKGRPIIYFKEH